MSGPQLSGGRKYTRSFVSSTVAGPGSQTQSRELWQVSLEKHRLRLKGHKYDQVFDDLNFDSFVESLDLRHARLGNSRVTRCINQLMPVFRHLSTFTQAINNLVQVQPNPLSLVWGSIQIVLICAEKFSQTLERITNMLKELTLATTRFNRYLELVGSDVLLYHLHGIYDAYVGFCIDVIIYFKKWPIRLLVSTFFSTLDQKFDIAISVITKKIDSFEKEVRINIDEKLVRGVDAINKSTSGQPRNEIVQGQIFHIAHSQNGFFTGRTKELEQLHEHLNSPSACQTSCVITAMGGTGKTFLANTYAYRYKSHYDWIFWLAAGERSELAQQFAYIGRLIALRMNNSQPLTLGSLAQEIEYSKIMLESAGSRWLLIYDNVENWETISAYWPRGDHGSIILTSQRSSLSQITGGVEISLQPLTPSEGAILLLRHLRKITSRLNLATDASSNSKQQHVSVADMAEAEEISRLLGGLPIAIASMAGWIDREGSSLEEFRKIYSQRNYSRQMWRQRTNATYQYDKGLDTVWDLALEELDPEALRIINILSLLNPDQTPEMLLFESDVHAAFNNSTRKSITSLRDRQLIARNSSSMMPFLTIHRALQLNLLHRLDEIPDKRQSIFDEAVKLVRRQFPRQSAIQAPTNHMWESCKIFLPQVLSLQTIFTSTTSPNIQGSMEFAELLCDAGNYLWERALHIQGIETLRVAQSICEGIKGNLMAQSKIYTIFGVICQEVGLSRREKGFQCCVKSLELRIKSYNEQYEEFTLQDHLLLANAWNDVACSLLEYERYLQAEAYLDRSIQIKRDLHLVESGEAHFNYAENFKNLSLVRIFQRRFPEAVELCEQAVTLMRDNATDSSGSISAFEFHLANAIFYNGELSKALNLHDAVWRRRRNVFGTRAAPTMSSCHAISMVYESLGQYGKAEEHLAEGVSIADESLPEELMSRSKFQLAYLMRRRGAALKHVAEFDNPARECMDSLSALLDVHLEAGISSSLDSIEWYDHIVSFECGRSTIGKLRFLPLQLAVDAG